jgi:fumarate reductase subunit C
MQKKKIDKTPARLDFIQSVTGLILGLFIMGHIVFEASILVSNEMMYRVTLMFEGYYFFGETHPSIVSFLAIFIFTIFIIHAGVAMRKFPANYKQFKTMKRHIFSLKHEDTSLWMLQAFTGFIMFFIGSVHLYMMISQPQNIGPYASSNRVVHELMGPLYVLLLLSVVTHAFIGLYRLALKWGFMEGTNYRVSRKRFKFLMRAFIGVYILLGFFSLAKYTYIGVTHNFSDCVKYESKTIHLEKH